MKELSAVVRAAVAVVKARADARRATEDGVTGKPLEKYRKAFSKALDDLERALGALAKVQPPAGAAPGAKTPPFDWGGIAKAGIALAKLVNRTKGKPRPDEILDIIDGEIVG